MRPMRFWHGYTREPPCGFLPWVRESWDRAKAGDWQKALALLADDSFVNQPCPFDDAHGALLHLAAAQGKLDVVDTLLLKGAWRSQQDARGNRPIEVARKHDQKQLYDRLKPQFVRDVPFAVLLEMQHYFHRAIRGWRGGPNPQYAEMMLPQLQPMLEVERIEFRFDIAHWCGGFNYELVSEGDEARLDVFGASRTIGGSGGRVEITRHGVKHIRLEGPHPP
jgi:hypothetical protein